MTWFIGCVRLWCFPSLTWNLGSGKSRLVRRISIKLLLPLLLDIMSGMLCLLVLRMPLVNSKILWMIFSILLATSPSFILMMSLFTPVLLMNTRNTCIHFWILSKEMVLLSLLRKSNYSKQKFASLAMISLKGKFIL